MEQNILSITHDTAAFEAGKKVIIEGLTQELELIRQIEKTKIAPGSTGGWQELKTQNAALTEQVEKLKQATAATNENVKAQKTNAQTAQAQTLSIKEGTDALSQNIKTQLEYSQRLKEITQQLKNIKDQYVQGKISLEAYKAQTIALTKEGAQTKNTLSLLSATIKAQIKDEQSAAGSLDQLRGKLLLLQKAFDSLSASQRNSSIGSTIKKQLADTNSQVVKLEESTGRFQRNVGNYKSVFEHTGEAIKDFAKAYIGLIGIQGVGQFLEKTVEEFQQAEAKIASLRNVLQNLGKEDVFERISIRAEEMAATFKTIKSEDVIQVFDKLITFGKLTENQINELTPVIVNFAAKQRISMGEATDAFTKFLGGGKAAIFKSYGIDVHDVTSETDKMVSSTDRLNLLMRDLKPRVDGAAEAFGKTAAGGIIKAKVEVEELEKSIGEKLQPVWSGFLTILLSGVKGIIEGFQQAKFVAVDMFQFFSDAGKNFNGFNFFDAIKAAKFEREAREIGVKYQIELAKIKQESAKTVEGITKEPLEVQERLLVSNLAIYQASQAAADTLFKSGTATKEQQKAAALRAIGDAQVYLGLQKAINSEKSKEILGFGSGEGADKKDTTPLKQVSKKFFDDELKDQEAAFKKLSESDQLNAKDRLTLRQQSYDIEKLLIEKNTESQIQQEKDKLDTVLNNDKSSKNARINAENEYAVKVAEITEKSDYAHRKAGYELASDLISINLTSKKKMLADDEAANKLFEEQQNTAYDSRIKALDKDLEVTTNRQKEARDISLANLEKNRTYTEAGEKEYQKKKLAIETLYLQSSLKANIDYTADIIALAKLRGQDVSKEEAKLAELRLQLIQAGGKQVEDTTKDQLAKQKTLYDGLKQIAQKALDFIQTLGDAKFEREKNQIQSLIDANNEFSQAETDRINNSTLSEVDKAAKLQQLQSATDAKNKQYAREQKQADIEKARFDKAAGIAKIILNTAIAITSALSIPVYGEIQAAIVAALGAAELAIAIATPIPTYKIGTEDHPGGLARYGEAGAEIVAEPGKQPRIVDTDTIGILAKGTRVIPLTAQRINDAMYGSAVMNMAERAAIVDAAERRNMISNNAMTNYQTDRIVNAIEANNKKQTIKIINKIDLDHAAWVNEYIYGKRK